MESVTAEESADDPRGASGPRRGRSAVPRFLATLAVSALAVAAGLAARTMRERRPEPEFPRREAEFLPVQEQDRRLAEAELRLKADAEDVASLTESGVLLFEKGPDRYPDAINALEEARRLGALDPRIFFYLGVMYQSEGLYSFAVAEYQKFLRNRPGDSEARLLLAKLEYQDGQFEDAAAQYRRLLPTHPRDPVVMENLALTLWKLRRDDEAVALLKEVGGSDPLVSRRAHYYLGQIAFEKKDYKQALRDFAVLLPVEGNPAFGIPADEVHAAVAANFEKLKLFREAKDHWERVLQVHPKDAKAKAGLRSAAAALKASERSAPRRRVKSTKSTKK